MKLSFKNILPILLISTLLILFAGCGITPSDEQPGYTPGTITGIIAAPCCSTSADPVPEPQGVAPEYWCYDCENTWSLQDGIEVVLTYGEDEVATVFTNEDGEYTFTDVPPGKNYVITAFCPDYADDRPLVKDVALELVEGGSFDAKITDCVSTALGLVVDYLVENSVLTPEDIVLDGVIAGIPNFYGFPEFKKLVLRICEISPGCVNLFDDAKVPDYLCRAAQEIGRKVLPDLDLGCVAGFTPGGGPTPIPLVVNYTVTYNANGGTGAVPTDANLYLQGATVTVLGQGSVVRTGYTFDGWNAAADGSGNSGIDYAAGNTFAMGTSNVTLYAQWTKLPCVYLSFNPGTRCYDYYESVYVNIENAINLHKAEITLQYTNSTKVSPYSYSIGGLMSPGTCTHTTPSGGGSTKTMTVVVTRNGSLEASGDGVILATVFTTQDTSAHSTVKIIGSKLYDNVGNEITHYVDEDHDSLILPNGTW